MCGSCSDTRTKDSSRTFTMIRWLDFLLVLFLVYQCGILPVGNDPIIVTGEPGGNVTLTCELKGHIISHLELHNQTGDIVCQTNECPSKFNKKGSCDVIIKDLIFSDAGKYFLTVYKDDGQTVLEKKIKEYHLHIHGNISAKIGKPLNMDVLLFNADKVEKNSNGTWTEVWTRGHGVWSNRVINNNETLIIKAFLETDAGTYRVLDSKEEIWVTVTVTESSPESGSKEGRINTKNDTEQLDPDTESNLNGTHNHGTNGTAENCHLIVGVSVGVGVLVVGAAVALIIYCVMKHKPQQRQHNYELAAVGDPVHN